MSCRRSVAFCQVLVTALSRCFCSKQKTSDIVQTQATQSWFLSSPVSQIDVIGAMMIVRRVRGKIIRSVLCSIVCNNCAQCNSYAHTHEQTLFVCWLDLGLLWLYCALQFICVRFGFFSTMPSDWLGRTIRNRSTLCPVWRKTLTQSILIFICTNREPRCILTLFYADYASAYYAFMD